MHVSFNQSIISNVIQSDALYFLFYILFLNFDIFFHISDEQMASISKYNFDHPDAFDWDLVKETLRQISQRNDVVIPRYNYKTCKRDNPGISVKCTDLILFEGIFALLDKEVWDMFDLKLFVDTDADIRLMRRINRDILERGREIEGVLKSYNRFVRHAYIDFIKPVSNFIYSAFFIVSFYIDNEILRFNSAPWCRKYSSDWIHFR